MFSKLQLDYSILKGISAYDLLVQNQHKPQFHFSLNSFRSAALFLEHIIFLSYDLLGGFPIEIKAEIRYLMICCYLIFKVKLRQQNFMRYLILVIILI